MGFSGPTRRQLPGNCHPQWQRFEDRNLLLIVDCEALPLLIITLVGCWLFQTIL